MGGSVRIPAAWSGVVGLKPGLGRIPMDVLPGLFDSISHHGPLARCADDARLFLVATQGPDDADIMSIPDPLDLADPLDGDVTGLRLGLSTTLGCWAVDPEIVAAVEATAHRLEAAGATVDVVDPGFRPEDGVAWMTLWAVFMATYFGDVLEEFRERMDPTVVNLIEVGRQVPATDYKRVPSARTDVWRRLRPILTDHDVLLCPTMSQPPCPAAKADGPPAPPVNTDGHGAADMTGTFNMVSPCPAISVPCGINACGGTPVCRSGCRSSAAAGAGHRVADRPRRRAHDAVLTVRSASSRTGVAAAIGVRRASWSSTTRSRPNASATTAPASRADERRGEVVPDPVGIRAHVDERVQRAGGDEAQVQCRRPEGAELRPAVGARGWPADAHDRRRG